MTKKCSNPLPIICMVKGEIDGAMCSNYIIGSGGLCGLQKDISCHHKVNPTPQPVKVEKKTLEKHVEAYLYKQMKKLGGECLKWASMNQRGVTDRICIFPPLNDYSFGVVCMVELKRDPSCKLSPTQVKFHAKMDALRVPNVYVLKSKEEVSLWIKSMGY